MINSLGNANSLSIDAEHLKIIQELRRLGQNSSGNMQVDSQKLAEAKIELIDKLKNRESKENAQSLGIQVIGQVDDAEFSKRAGTENVPAIAAMALALEKNCRDMKTNAEKLSVCAKILLDRLKNSGIDFIVNGGGNRLPGHLSLSFKNCDGETLMHRLDLKNICVATGSACNSRQTKISHVLKALHVPEDYIRGTIRVTFGVENTFEDAEIIGEALIKILARL